jgi:phage protein D
MPAVSYNLKVDGRPLSPDLMSAIQQVEVEDHSLMADMLRLQLAISVKDNGAGWTILDDDLFKRLSNIKIEIVIGSGKPIPLIDSYVIETQAQFSNTPGKSALKVIAMDPTVLMNLDEKVKPWPNMAEGDIASAIFSDYGFTPDVDTTQPARQEVDTLTIQRGTDIQLLKNMADRHGFECYVELDPNSGSIKGHFHKPRLAETPQGVLSVNMGSATNVNSFAARYEMLRPVAVQVTGLDIETQSNQAAKAEDSSLSSMGSSPASGTDRPRNVLLSKTGLSQTGELQTYAQAIVDRSSWAILADGELNTVAYGGVLRAKSPVLVRGAGKQFSGTYYVDRVLHIITGDGYLQRFSLRRNALGVTKNENFAEDNALSS